MSKWQPDFGRWFGFEGLEPDEYNNRLTTVNMAAFTGFCGLLYSVIYSALGFPSVALVSYVYIGIVLLSFVYLRISKNYLFFRNAFLVLILLLPFAAQLAIGGFFDSSGVILASFITPVCALLITNRRSSRRYFYLFILLLAVAASWEYLFLGDAPNIPRGIVLIFYFNNYLFICAIIYFIIEVFLKKNEELQDDLKQSLSNLRRTQAKLIQSEKMASLGELTAGIAHEIQNPLNFVNNFAEVNSELLEELREEREKETPNQGLVEEILRDLADNMEKMVYHGKRADSIVKGMLMHSRTGSGEKKRVDVNALADEYMRLAYHGLRAKEKSFNATLEKDFQPQVIEASVRPQDFGRVLLNIFNNAFYAVRQRKAVEGEGYRPTVWLRSKLIDNGVEIRIRDNGSGIPDEVRAKIFEPFFTTKPTGQGTGLGLSLSYDIVHNGHGGTLEVESEKGTFTEFIVKVPLDN